MSENKDRNVLPQQYILNLFDKTKDRKLAITYYPTNGEQPYDLTYDMDWTKESAESLAKKCESLIAMLDRLTLMYDELLDENKRKDLLTDEELNVWNTFVRLFKPFEVSEAIINDLYRRGEFDELSEEENDLLERHYAWREAECLERLPFNRCSPVKFITAAMHYVLSRKWNMPENEISDNARLLAEEMVLYYCSTKKD